MREANDQRIRLERLKRLKYHKENPSSGGTNYEGEQYEGHRHIGGLMGLYGPHSYSAQTSPWPETARRGVFLGFLTLSMCCI